MDASISYINAQKIEPEDLANKIIKKIDVSNDDYVKCVFFTKEDATEQLYYKIKDIVKQYSSSMYIVNQPTSIQIFKNIDCAKNSEYGAYIYCIEGGYTPKFKIINMSVFDFGEIECTQDELVNLLLEVFLV